MSWVSGIQVILSRISIDRPIGKSDAGLHSLLYRRTMPVHGHWVSIRETGAEVHSIGRIIMLSQ